MSALLDPWDDAQAIATRLQRADVRLVILIGAEAWCEKCRILRPMFEQRANCAPATEVWMWLDLEEHTEFIGDYLPHDLPLLIQYRGPTLLGLTALGTDEAQLDQALAEPGLTPEAPHPPIRDRLLREDWA